MTSPASQKGRFRGQTVHAGHTSARQSCRILAAGAPFSGLRTCCPGRCTSFADKNGQERTFAGRLRTADPPAAWLWSCPCRPHRSVGLLPLVGGHSGGSRGGQPGPGWTGGLAAYRGRPPRRMDTSTSIFRQNLAPWQHTWHKSRETSR